MIIKSITIDIHNLIGVNIHIDTNIDLIKYRKVKLEPMLSNNISKQIVTIKIFKYICIFLN
ncbi:hypothetical protein, partial [Paraclostridium bifermentans]|uniref:hypothetical protein n=1 Tax=Paraclostridium bifermentans TaxID=1490 RepID=UPI001A9B7092